MRYPEDNASQLADRRFAVTVGCERCRRRKRFEIAALLAHLGSNAPLKEVPRLVALKGGCTRAVGRYGRHTCEARIE